MTAASEMFVGQDNSEMCISVVRLSLWEKFVGKSPCGRLEDHFDRSWRSQTKDR
jgi:hypothetical protein